MQTGGTIWGCCGVELLQAGQYFCRHFLKMRCKKGASVEIGEKIAGPRLDLRSGIVMCQLFLPVDYVQNQKQRT